MEHIPEVPSSPMRLMKDRFTEVRKLGAGNFGDAFLVIDKKYDCHRVVKRLHKSIQQMSPKTLQESRAEIANLSKVDHHHVVKFFRAWFDVDCHLHMLMEYCESGDLEDFVKSRFPLPEVLVRSLFIQLLAGMDDIHHNHLLHRDIKAKNIFMTRVYVGHPKSPDPIARQAAAEVGRHVDARVIPHLATDSKGFAIVLKIGDFGLSKALNFTEDKAKTVAGTPFHFSPELARNHAYTRRTDVWSLGVLFYFILTLSMPFRGKTIQEVFCSILREKVPHPATRFQELYKKHIPYSSELIEIVMDMMNKTESLRPTTEEILSRRYFGGNGVPSPSSPNRSNATASGGVVSNPSPPQSSVAPPPSVAAADHHQRRSSATSQQQNQNNNTNNFTTTTSQQQQCQHPNTHRMCVARSDALVNIRAQPSLRAEVIGTLRHQEEIQVVRAVDSFGHTWWQICAPINGYCISAHEGKELFVLKRSGHDPMRLSPLARGGGGATPVTNTNSQITNNQTTSGLASALSDSSADDSHHHDDGGGTDIGSYDDHRVANDDDETTPQSSAECDAVGRYNNKKGGGRRHRLVGHHADEDDESSDADSAVDSDSSDDLLEIVGHRDRQKEVLREARREKEAMRTKKEKEGRQHQQYHCGDATPASRVERNRRPVNYCYDEGDDAAAAPMDDDDDDQSRLLMFSFSDAAPPPQPKPKAPSPRATAAAGHKQQSASSPSSHRGQHCHQYPQHGGVEDDGSGDDDIVIVDRAKEKKEREARRDAKERAAREAEEEEALRMKKEKKKAAAAAAAIGISPSSPSPRPSSHHQQQQQQQNPPRRVSSEMATVPMPLRPTSAAHHRASAAAPPSSNLNYHYQQQQHQQLRPDVPRRASPLAAQRFGDGGHISPIRHRKSPQVNLPPLTTTAQQQQQQNKMAGRDPNLQATGRSSPIKYFREVSQQQPQPKKG